MLQHGSRKGGTCGAWFSELAKKKLAVMQSLDIFALHELRLAVFDNAEELHKEAKLLFQHKMFSRAYLLAYYCFEELGKIPIVVGVIGKLIANEHVDWKTVEKRFYSHTSKIESQNTHYYTFGLDLDLLRDRDLKWLEAAQSTVSKSFDKKNFATYVDVRNGVVVLPSKKIEESDAAGMLDLAFNCLKAHWHSERLTNPILLKLQNPASESDG
jgi:hypothetical protein